MLESDTYPRKLKTQKEYNAGGDYPDWPCNPAAGHSSGYEKLLIDNDHQALLMGLITDDEASYDYDEWALIYLKGNYYMLATSGCSCPSPRETWRLEKGPATLDEIKEHVVNGDYEGYTMPKKQLSDFLTMIDNAKKMKVNKWLKNNL